MKKPPRTIRLRGKSEKKNSGQVGHQGKTLERVSKPDQIIKHPTPECCNHCGCSTESGKLVNRVIRQVFDVTKPKSSRSYKMWTMWRENTAHIPHVT